MKEKMTNVKNFIIEHKKQILIGAGVTVLSIVGITLLSKKFQEVEIYDEDVEELTSGTIDVINE